MVEPLPPLAATRVFEAAARQLSFTKAAAELGMTQAAVSYQIKVIEDRVGAPLFLRRPRQVQLTETGRRLAAAASQAFDLLRDAYAEARGVTDGMLVINSLQTFATNWLAQHLGSFQIAHPRIAVRIEIENVLDEGLPRAYGKEMFEEKCGTLFEHVFESYQGEGRSVFQAP